MGSTSSETPPSSSARRTDQETSDQKEPNRSSTCGNEAFLFNCFKPKPKLTRDSNSDSDEVDKFTRFINDDMEFISKVSEKLGEYEDEIQELKRRFNELLIMAKNTTTDDYHVVGLASELYFLQGKVTNLKERLSAKESEAKALRKMIDADQGFISKVSDKTQMYKETKESVKERLPNLGEYGGTVVQLRDLKKKVTKEKQRITSKQKDGSKEEEEEEEEEEPESTRYDQSRSHVTGTASTKGGHAALEQMPNLSKSFALAESSVFKDFEARYYELRIELRQCLLCFSVFPENAKINKRVMTYWWIGEGFVPPLWSEVSVPPSNKKQNNHNSSSKTAEDYANDFFYELIAKDFIAPSSKSSPGLASLVGVKTCKMNPFVRSMVIVLAKRVKFFDFDDDVNVTSDYTSSHRACLTGKQLDFNSRDLDLLYTLFNVSQPVLGFNPGSFRRMKYVKVLYLGRWQTRSTYHVDIVLLDVLEELGHAKNLRFLSLQRMSKMMKLPVTILKLKNLAILDIRACQNLEEIPNGIGSLVNLTHLDMSECYLLDHMPKGLSLLINLQVLAGFVVGESDDSPRGPQCTLADLQSMKKLRKLSIDTSVEQFPSHDQLRDLNKLETLRKLTIAWGFSYAPEPRPAKKEPLPLLGSSPSVRPGNRTQPPSDPFISASGGDNKGPESVAADKARTTSNYESKEKLTCFPWLKAPKCLWDKRNTSSKENSAPKPLSTEVEKDNSASELPPPQTAVEKDNTALELPPQPPTEVEKDNSASRPPPAAEVGKDNSASEPPQPTEVGKGNSAPEPPPPTEVRRDNSAPKPPAAAEVAKDNSAPQPPPAAEVRKDNSAPEPPVTTEIGKDNSALEPPPPVEVEKDNIAPELPPAVEVGKDNSVIEPPPPAEVGIDNSAPEPPLMVAEEARKDSSAPEPPLAEEVGKDNSALKPKIEEIGEDNSSPKPLLPEESRRDNSALEPLAAEEEAGKNNSAPESPRAKDVGKDSRAPEPALANEVPKSNSAVALIGAEEIRKDSRITEPPAVPEKAKKNNSAAESLEAIDEGEKDNSASKATSRTEESEECKTEQEQKLAEVKAAATKGQTRTTVEKKHVCFPCMKALKHSRVDGVETQPPSTKDDQTSTSTRGQLEAKLPTRLEKLDLQCFPDNKDTEDWLKSGNLPNLKKLYIRGGKCFDLGANSGAGDEGKGTKQPDPKEWQVEVLRLKYLADLKMEWKQLQSLFPNLSYLETVDCPKLSFFPCDEKGVWIKKSIKS